MPVRCCVVLVALVALVCAACSGASTGSNSDTTELTVFAAASLGTAFGDIETAFEAEQPSLDVQLNIAGSSALREQILAGAPAHVFAAANTSVMDELVAAGEVGEPSLFAENAMELAVPVGNPAGIRSLNDFSNDGLLLGTCAVGVPCGDAATAVFVAAGIAPALDTTEPDVRALVTKLAEGELDAGIVYRSDVVANAAIDGIVLADDVNVVVRYPIAIRAELASGAAAQTFVDFVLGAEGQRILATAGFAPTEAAE